MARSRTAKDGDASRPYAGVPPAERKSARRKRLLDSALALFGTDGYQATSIERLCTHAGVTARHFYEEFEGREALLFTLYEIILADARDAVIAALAELAEAAEASSSEPIAGAVSAFLHSYLDDPRRARIATLEVVGVSVAMEQRRREAMRLFARLIETEAGRMANVGALPARDFELTSIAMAGAGNELLVEWLWRDDKPTIDRLSRELVDLFVAVIRGVRTP